MRIYFQVLTALVFALPILAQSPDKLSYQAVIRNTNNALVANTQISIKISILQTSENGTARYIETQKPSTNANGLISIEIGEGTKIYGDFATIDWSAGPYFIKTETDPSGGTNYTITGTSQLLSVPYALYAKNAGNGFSGNFNDLKNKPLNIVPLTATRDQLLSVSFSGGDLVTFSQASTSCPDIYADVLLKIEQGSSTQGLFTQGSPTQGSSTIIYPLDSYFIDSKRFDAIFDIPSYVPSGVYDIILGPFSPCPYTINSAFKIY